VYSLPHFFQDTELIAKSNVMLEDSTAWHVVQVLRMQAGERLLLVDGKGVAAAAVITEIGKKKCGVFIEEVRHQQRPTVGLHLAVAFTKHAGRNEWMIEKATELGVASIIPLYTSRCEKVRLNRERLRNILVAAMLQSQRYYLPDLTELQPIRNIITGYASIPQKAIAHCTADEARQPIAKTLKPQADTLMLIGPEGDFDAEEVNLCMQAGFEPVSLGVQRLRTETAAIAVCAYFNLINEDEK
jgi:16S rRNA (uracil1498-N3)-methyltransferase